MQKVCIVSGGSSGIGLSVVQSFLASGHQVFNLDIQPGEFGEYVHCDMTSIAAIEHAIDAIFKQMGSIDIVVPNAGVHLSATIEDTTEEDFDSVMNLNVRGTWALIKSVIPIMKRRKSGVITIIASEQALVGKKHSCVYNMSKHALVSLAKTTALDYASEGIRVNAVCPGTIETAFYHKAIDIACKKTGMNKSQMHLEEAQLQPIGRLGKPEEVAALVNFLSSEQAGFITGSVQVIDGGYTCQ